MKIITASFIEENADVKLFFLYEKDHVVDFVLNIVCFLVGN